MKFTSWFRKMYNRVTKVVPDLPVEVMRIFCCCCCCCGFEVILLYFVGVFCLCLLVVVWLCVVCGGSWFHKIESVFGFGFEDILCCYLLEFYNLFLTFVFDFCF